MKRIKNRLLRIVLKCTSILEKTGIFAHSILLIIDSNSPKVIQDLRERFAFYAPKHKLDIFMIERALSLTQKLKMILMPRTVLLFVNGNPLPSFFSTQNLKTFNINFITNPFDALEWCNLVEHLEDTRPDIEKAHRIFSEYVNKMKGSNNLDKTYVFGTGPSLEKAIEKDWSDGYRAVCNTIVRDAELWKHLQPHFITGGDPNYHLANNLYAKSFREDLKKRLKETSTLFIYPASRHSIVFRELSEFQDRLIPIPVGHSKEVGTDLTLKFELPAVGNALGLLLLPLSCTLSKNIFLWGFDGRAPDDKGFWSNSPKHSYPEYIEHIWKDHPAFLEHYVPKSDPFKYVKSAQGDELDESMKKAELGGWKFTMMHKSWTAILNRRFISS